VSDAVWQALVIFTVIGLIVEALVLVGILRQLGVIVLQLGPPRHGEVEGPEAGTQVTIDSLRPGVPAVVLFLSSGCDICKPIAAALPAMRRSYAGLQLLPVVVGDDDPATHAYAATLGGDARTDLDTLYREWEVPGTPFAVGVGEDGRVKTSGIVNSLPQLETLAEVTLRPQPVPASADLLALDTDARARSLDGDPSKGA
jgi:hypothetical protein